VRLVFVQMHENTSSIQSAAAIGIAIWRMLLRYFRLLFDNESEACKPKRNASAWCLIVCLSVCYSTNLSIIQKFL